MAGIEETGSAMTAIKQQPGVFLLALLLSVGLMAATAWSAPQSKPGGAEEGDHSTPAEDNMDHVVGEELC